MISKNIGFHNKSAVTDYPVHDLIRERWSPRAFSERTVEPEKLHSLFEAARWAASGGNKQPWYFVYATKETPEEHARFVSTLSEGNVRWAINAPVLIFAIARRAEYVGKELNTYYDLGLAVGNLVLQAVDLGLVTHQMGGFDVGKAREVLQLPEGYDPLAIIALGYLDDHTTLPDDLREREIATRVRKLQHEFVFKGRWQ